MEEEVPPAQTKCYMCTNRTDKFCMGRACQLPLCSWCARERYRPEEPYLCPVCRKAMAMAKSILVLVSSGPR